MTTALATSTQHHTPPTSGRDQAVDLVRAACLIAVVTVHALMVGISLAQGEPVLENALESWSGFAVFSWFAQMMPLFFIAGGFASAAHYRRHRGRGGSATGYVGARLARLLPVPLLAGLATVLGLSALELCGLAPEIVATAGWRMSQPLWFLGVYVLCSAFVPLFVMLHERAPRLTLAALGAGIVAVDVLRAASGAEAIGFVNLVFVWLFVQQLGFWLADGRAPGLRIGGLAVVAAAVWISVGFSSPNLYEALNPPTAALALLGVVQCALFAWLRPALAKLAQRPGVRQLSDVINQRSMTIYSWHMPVTVLLAGGLLAFAGAELPAPLGLHWWLSRPLWLGGVALAVIAVVLAVTNIERAALERIRPALSLSTGRTVTAVLLGAGGVLVILAAGGSAPAWTCGIALLGGALALSVHSTPADEVRARTSLSAAA